jgi:hypothetical protein
MLTVVTEILDVANVWDEKSFTLRKLDLPLSSGPTEEGSGVNYRGEALMDF